MVHPAPPVAPRSAPPAVDRFAAITRIRRLPIVAALVAIAFGVAVVQGYVFGVEPLVLLAPFLPPTQPLVAVLFVLTGVSLLSLRTGLVRLALARLGPALLEVVAALFEPAPVARQHAADPCSGRSRKGRPVSKCADQRAFRTARHFTRKALSRRAVFAPRVGVRKCDETIRSESRFVSR